MTADPAADLVRWVKDGEHLFGLALESLQRAAAAQHRLETLAQENARLRQEAEALRRELDVLRAERLEVVDTFKVSAEHVTRLATLALQRLGTPGMLTPESPRRQGPPCP
jgi:hypothetical protein